LNCSCAAAVAARTAEASNFLAVADVVIGRPFILRSASPVAARLSRYHRFDG